MKLLIAILAVLALIGLAAGIEETDNAYVQGHIAGFWMASLAAEGNTGNETAKALYNENVDRYNAYLEEIGLASPETMLKKFEGYELPAGLKWEGWDNL
jgi:hypothetical protein